MIKKFLLWLWISFLSFVGFSSAWKFQIIWLDWSSSIYDTWYDITFLKWWWVLSSFIWQSRSVLAFTERAFFWWSVNWKPYYFDNSYQGYFWEYRLCDYFSDTTSQVSWCVKYEMTWDYKEVFINFFKWVNQWDVAFYDYEKMDLWSSYYDNTVQVCFSSSQWNRSLCFRQHSCYNWRWCSAYNYWSLVNSENLPNSLTYWSIKQSWLWYAPGQAWYDWWWNIDWSSNTSVNVSLTWNLLYNTCTKWYVISKVRYIYWNFIDNVCYAWSNSTWYVTDDMSWFFPVPWYWLSYLDLYNDTSDWMSWATWFRNYEDEMLRYKSWRLPVNPFLSRPIPLYSYFDLLYDNWFLWQNSDDRFDWMVWPYFIYNYCKILLDNDYDSDYNWTFFKSACDDLNYLDSSTINTWEIWSVWDPEIIPPFFDWWNSSVNSSWSIISVDWSWVLSGSTNQNFDWKNFINNFYQKLQSVFQKPYNNFVWIIPGYIVVFLLALILFRFLSR